MIRQSDEWWESFFKAIYILYLSKIVHRKKEKEKQYQAAGYGPIKAKVAYGRIQVHFF